MRICELIGKKTIFGNNRSKSLRATRRVFEPNLHYKKLNFRNREVRLRISSKALRTVKKYGSLDNFLLNVKFKKFLSPRVLKLRKELLTVNV